MSERERELAERYEKLRLRCAWQRRAIAAEVQTIHNRFGSIDRFAIMTRSALLQPRVLLAGIVGLLAFGRVRGLHTIGRIFLLLTAARRLWGMVKLI